MLLSFRVLHRELIRNKCALRHQNAEGFFFFRNFWQNMYLYDIMRASFKSVNFKPHTIEVNAYN